MSPALAGGFLTTGPPGKSEGKNSETAERVFKRVSELTVPAQGGRGLSVAEFHHRKINKIKCLQWEVLHW